MKPDFSAARRRMVDGQIARRGIHDPLVLEAMRTVPRERFVSDNVRYEAYDDRIWGISALGMTGICSRRASAISMLAVRTAEE